MRLGVLLPHRAVVLQSGRRPPLEVCWTVARLCDEAGLDLWVGDSVVAKPRHEPLTTLAYLAAITQRARLGTAVLLPALRQPTVLAHTLANIDQLSHGRLVLGLPPLRRAEHSSAPALVHTAAQLLGLLKRSTFVPLSGTRLECGCCDG